MSASESCSALVLELAEEFLERYRQGQRPPIKEYIDRHPQLSAEIKEVFPAMALMENIALADESLAGTPTGPEMAGAAAAPEQLGDYRILREIGRGGMGIVYEAEQMSLGRHVALKVLPRKLLLDVQQKRRFEREAKAAAKLHHTNIVPIFGVGEHEGMPYYVMQFIQGMGLDEVCDELKRMRDGPKSESAGEASMNSPAGASGANGAEKQLSAADAARSLLTGSFHEMPENRAEANGDDQAKGGEASPLADPVTLSSATVKLPGSPSSTDKGKKATFWHSLARIGVQVAGALEYAHKQGILHRDIKPSNLLMDRAGTVWVADFGLARAEHEDRLTETGDIVGTLRYMPPEAFEGRTDARSDLYSLGLTLYELLALRPAFEEKVRHKLLKQVTTEEPPRLEKLNRAIPRDFATIVHKAINREPARRYRSAGELATDLQRFLDDEPIHARRISGVERCARWCRRHPGVAGLTAALAVLLLAVTVASLIAAVWFDRAATNERAARLTAEQAEIQAGRNLKEAQKQKQQAEANFAEARRAVDESFIKISENQLLTAPGMQPLRRDLLQSARTFYQGFLKQHGEDPSLRGELAATFLRAGVIYFDLGENAEGRKAFHQASEMYEALTKAEPESIDWRNGLAHCYYRLGRIDEAIVIWEKLVHPGQPRFYKELAGAYNRRALNAQRDGKLAEAFQMGQLALTIREMLVRLNPDDVAARHDLGGSLNNVGNLFHLQGRLKEALAMYRQAAESCAICYARQPQLLEHGRDLGTYHYQIAAIERRMGHDNEALAAYRRCLTVRRKVASDHPAIPATHRLLFSMYWELTNYQRQLKQIEQAKQTLRMAGDTIDRLPSEGAEALFYQACVRAKYSSILSSGKGKATDEDRAGRQYHQDLAMEALRKAIDAGLGDLGRIHTSLQLNALRGREDFKALETEIAKGTALSRRPKPPQVDPKNKQFKADLAASQRAIGLIHFQRGKLDEAEKYLQQALALREALLQDESNLSKYYQGELASSRLYLNLIRARRFIQQQRNEDAQAVLARTETFTPDNPVGWKERGRLYFALGQIDKATADFRKAVELLGDMELSSEPAVSEADKLFMRLADDAFLKRLTAAIESKPEDMAKRSQRAEWYAQRRRWQEAAADFKFVLQHQPVNNAHPWLHAAPALVAAEDHDGYHWQRREMVKRFAPSRDPTAAARIAKACLLLPEPGNDTELACQLADRAADWGKNNGYAQAFELSFPKGLADYRRQKDRAAIAGLEPLLTKSAKLPARAALCHLVLAMASNRQGQAKAAHEHLAEGAKLLDQNVPDSARFPTYSSQEYAHDWLIAWLLHREARTLIEGRKGGPNK